MKAAFPGDTQDAGQDGELQRGVRLEGRTEEVAEEADGLVVVVIFPGCLDRRVVFVQQKNRFLSVVF